MSDITRTLLADGRKKVAVVISDVLRYEVADELAALLPHDTIGHSTGGDPVLVDGQRIDGTTNRSTLLEISPETDKITTGQIAMKLYQVEPVGGKVRPRVLRAGLYLGIA